MTTSALDALAAFGKPSPSDIDVSGLTHRGHVREANADHFLVASLHRALHVHSTSLEGERLAPLETESRGYLLLVADGVGSHESAREGSARAINAVVQYILHMAELCSQLDPAAEQALMDALRASVLLSHEALRADDGGATTLTMVAVRWPRAYVVHAGDSRCYRLRGEALERMTADQTMAQLMVDAGAIAPESAAAARLKHVLWSALGSGDVAPEVRVTDCERRDVVLLCTDGLTRHVSDAEIRDCLASGAPSEAVCRTLVELALSRGGEDNVTVVVGRIRT
jgi:protein phosphatase